MFFHFIDILSLELIFLCFSAMDVLCLGIDTNVFQKFGSVFGLLCPFDQYNTFFLLFFKQLRKSPCFFFKSQRAAVCVFMSLDIGPRCEQHIRATPILCIDNHIHFELLKLLIVLASLCLDNCILFVSHIRKLKFTLSKCLDLPAIEYNGNETYCFYSAHFYRFQVQSSPCLVHSIIYVAET